ncbi:MAG: hypothetical protein E7609_07265 [Ruminococcaceae bacterium]|nr:hypothetical protein [Oscillospiraceae bacterium]
MKKHRILLIIVCIFMILCGLSGCAQGDKDANARLEAGTREMLDALLADDTDGAYAVVGAAVAREEFLPVYAEMREMLSGVSSYALRQLGTNKAGKEYAVSFLVTADAEDGERSYAVTAYEREGVTGLSAFLLQRNEDEVVPRGDLRNMKGAGALSWGMLALGGLSWLFVLAAAVDCGRNAKRNRGIMLFIILFGMATLGFTLAPSAGFSLVHGYYEPYSAFLLYPDGGEVLRLFLPLGAIGWFVLRGRFTHSDE